MVPSKLSSTGALNLSLARCSSLSASVRSSSHRARISSRSFRRACRYHIYIVYLYLYFMIIFILYIYILFLSSFNARLKKQRWNRGGAECLDKHRHLGACFFRGWGRPTRFLDGLILKLKLGHLRFCANILAAVAHRYERNNNRSKGERLRVPV